MGILEHTYDKTELTEQTMFSGTVCGDVRLGELSDGKSVMHHLQDRIRVRIQDVGFQTTTCSLIVESEGRGQIEEEVYLQPCTRNQSLLRRILSIRSQLCDICGALRRCYRRW